MVKSGKVRASGETAASEEAKAELEVMDDPVEIELPDERERTFRTPGFSRMRTEWSPEDAGVLARAKAVVDGMIYKNFMDAYEIMFQIYDLVRTPVVDDNGEIQTDQWGFTLWKQNASGSFEEDWSRLTHHEKEKYLFTITTRLFDLQQRAGDVWREAMFAKAKFEERFSVAFDAPMRGTVDDRKAKGNIDARDERYFAILWTSYSRQVDSLIRSLDLLGQRIRDTL